MECGKEDREGSDSRALLGHFKKLDLEANLFCLFPLLPLSVSQDHINTTCRYILRAAESRTTLTYPAPLKQEHFSIQNFPGWGHRQEEAVPPWVVFSVAPAARA